MSTQDIILDIKYTRPLLLNLVNDPTHKFHQLNNPPTNNQYKDIGDPSLITNPSDTIWNSFDDASKNAVRKMVIRRIYSTACWFNSVLVLFMNIPFLKEFFNRAKTSIPKNF